MKRFEQRCLVVGVLTFTIFIGLSYFSTAVYALGTPAGDTVGLGKDNGTANTADTWGDVVGEFRSFNGDGTDTQWKTTPTVAETTIIAVYGDTLPDTVTAQNATAGNTVYYSIYVTNLGNATDSFVVDTIAIAGNAVPWSNYWFADTIGGVPGDSITRTLAADAASTFILAVVINPGAAPGDTVLIDIKATAKAGAGGDTGGYIGFNTTGYCGDGDDSASILTTLIGADMYLAVSSGTVTIPSTYDGATNPIPGARIIKTVYYDNDGNDSTVGFTLETYVPKNATIDTATPAMSSPHTGATTIVEFSNNGTVWNPTYVVGDNRVRFRFTTDVGPTNGDAVGTVEASPADVDAGWVQIRYIIN